MESPGCLSHCLQSFLTHWTDKSTNLLLMKLLFQKHLFVFFFLFFSSILPPKDESFFRAERELVLRRALQVGLNQLGGEIRGGDVHVDGAARFSGGRSLAGAVAGRRHAEGAGELPGFGAHSRESASASASGHTHTHTHLREHLIEFRPFKSLICSVLQFFSDRSSHLAQTKYLLMLRWRRFCRHAGAIQELHPHYRVSVSPSVGDRGGGFPNLYLMVFRKPKLTHQTFFSGLTL